MQRAYWLRLYYGITLAQYAAMFKRQKGRCALCLTKKVGQRRKKNLCVDHDHKTGRVRGLLCFRCNRALGLFQDDPKILRRVLRYLKGSHGIP
jgi:hypothetical protein